MGLVARVRVRRLGLGLGARVRVRGLGLKLGARVRVRGLEAALAVGRLRTRLVGDGVTALPATAWTVGRWGV